MMINMYFRSKYGFKYFMRFLVCIFDIFSFITNLILQFELYIGGCNQPKSLFEWSIN